MTPRRMQTTTVPKRQSVRFYKIVALSFLCLTVILFGIIVFMSSKRATIVITTKPSPVDVTTTVDVGEEAGRGQIAGEVKTLTVSSTATGIPTDTKSVSGVAKGVVTLHNDTNLDQPLIATTRLLTPDDVLFRLEERVTVPANGTVTASVYADVEGPGGDVGPVKRFSIPGLQGSSKYDNIYASSDKPMTGGDSEVGVVGEEDITKAEKTLKEKLLTEAKEQLEDMVTGDYEVVYGLINDTVSPVDDVLGSEVSTFTVAGSATVVGVFYRPDDAREVGLSALMKHVVDDSESLEPSEEYPTVTFESYDEPTDTATIEIFYDGIVTLAPESKQIQKVMFFGKDRDEVRRYVLSIDHVKNVDVQFSPAWTRSVPHVADHVNVVVKRME